MHLQQRLGYFLLNLACLGVFSFPAFAQANGSGGLTISGYVQDDDDHQTLKAAALQLIRTSGEVAAPATISGLTGEYRFEGLISGEYRILAKSSGYEPASINVMLGVTSLANVSVNLHRVRGSLETGLGEAISAHQLSAPQNAREDFEKGMKLLLANQPNYRRALSCFERAVKEFPDYYEAYAEMGVAYQHLGEAAEAEKALRKSVEMSVSRYPDALFLLAEMLNDVSRFSDAEGFARQCVQQDDSLWSCDREQARALVGLKRPGEAEVIARKAVELNPNDAKTYLVLGNVHIQEHKYQAVVEDFDAYLKLDPSGPASDAVRLSQAQARKALDQAPHPH